MVELMNAFKIYKFKFKPIELNSYPNSYIIVINGKNRFILCISLKKTNSCFVTNCLRGT